MEASYFYYRPSDLFWAGQKGKWLDKGYNVKFSYKPKKNYFPTFAIGLDDFAGTGYLSREYVMSTYSTESLKISAGLGWGKYSSGAKNYKNPLSFISNSFDERGSEYGSDNESLLGGQLTYSSWFSGPVSFLGGLEWSIPYSNGLKFKIEHDPFDYNDFSANFRSDRDQILREKDSDYNFGFAYKINDYVTLNLSYIKGNTLNLHFSIGAKTNNPKKKVIKKPKVKKLEDSFYIDLLNNMNRNASFLQTAQLNENSLDIAIMNDTFKNPIRASMFAADIASEVLKNHNFYKDKINITTINAGFEMNTISYRNEDIQKENPIIDFKKLNTQIKNGDQKNYLNHEFKPIVRYPKFFNTFSPEIVTHIGTPNLPLLKGLEISAQSELQLHRQVSIVSDIRYAITNDFDSKASFPGSDLPNVRTEIVRYLQDSDLYIRNLQLDYFWSPYKNIYGKISTGLFESMYGGLGLEMAYKPFYRNFVISFDAYQVKKRSYEQRLEFFDYETSTAHLNFTYNFKPINIYANISYGRYLAKDDGFTYDFSRRTESGFVAGFYFTRTDVPFELFGEGSFDKGFYFELPLSVFYSEPNRDSIKFGLRPLTRDGGAKLEISRPLKSVLIDNNYYDIVEGWNEYD